MDKKTYKAWMAKIAEGEKVSKKVFDELVEFAKAKKVKRPQPDSIKPRKTREKKEPTNCLVTKEQDPAVGKEGCQKPSRALGLCVAHYSRLKYRADEERAEKVREASRRYAAKKREERKAAEAAEAVLQDA